MTDTTLQRRADRLVSREVLCCLSGLVATLAEGAGTVHEPGSACRPARLPRHEKQRPPPRKMTALNSALAEKPWLLMN